MAQRSLYRVAYLVEKTNKYGDYTVMDIKAVNDTLENIKRKFKHIYYLTDINGDVIIDNRKGDDNNDS